jgi:integrase
VFRVFRGSSLPSKPKCKTAVLDLIHLPRDAVHPLNDLSAQGPSFPYRSRLRAAPRTTDFAPACRRLKINGTTLRSRRHACAERAKTVGYPERFAQEALGHKGKAVHRAYARHALVKIPSLEEHETQASQRLTELTKRPAHQRKLAGPNRRPVVSEVKPN